MDYPCTVRLASTHWIVVMYLTVVTTTDIARCPQGDQSIPIENPWAKLVTFFPLISLPYHESPQDGGNKGFANLPLLGLSYLKIQVPRCGK